MPLVTVPQNRRTQQTDVQRLPRRGSALPSVSDDLMLRITAGIYHGGSPCLSSHVVPALYVEAFVTTAFSSHTHLYQLSDESNSHEGKEVFVSGSGGGCTHLLTCGRSYNTARGESSAV